MIIIVTAEPLRETRGSVFSIYFPIQNPFSFHLSMLIFFFDQLNSLEIRFLPRGTVISQPL